MTPVPVEGIRKIPQVKRKNIKGEISLHVEARRGNAEECKRLIEEGACVNAVDHAGWLPIHEACGGNSTECVALLISHGAEVNSNSNDVGVTPLHDACAHHNYDMIKVLLENGADPTIKNLRGVLCTDYLLDQDDGEILKLFEVEYPKPSTSQAATKPSVDQATTSSSSSSSSTTTSPEKEDQDQEEEDEEMAQPACRSSALISTELPKNEEEEPTPSVSPDDPTFTLTTPRRAASTRAKRSTTNQIKKQPSTRPQRKSRGAKKISPGGEQTRRGKPRSVKRGGGVASISYHEPEDIEEKQTEEYALQRKTASIYLGAGDTAPSSSYSSSVSAPPRSFIRDLDKRFSAMSSHGESSKGTKEDVYEFRDDEEDTVPLPRFESTTTTIKQLKRKFEEEIVPRKVPPLRITLKPPEEAVQSEDIPSKEKEKKNKDKNVEPEVEIIAVKGGKRVVKKKKKIVVRKKKYRKENVDVALPPEGHVLKTCASTAKQRIPLSYNRRFLRRDGIYEKPAHFSNKPIEVKVTVVTDEPVNEPSSSSNVARTVKPNRKIIRSKDRCLHMLHGDPNRACHTVENQFRRNFSHPDELRVHIRPVMDRELGYLCHKVDRDWDYFPRMIRNFPKPKDPPADCPPEMIELWKEYEEERTKLTNKWELDKQRVKCQIQRRMIHNAEYRYRQKNGDFTVKPHLLTLFGRATAPNAVIVPQKAPIAQTEEETLEWAAKYVEQVRWRQFIDARIIYKRQVACWKMDIRKFHLPKSMYKKRLDYFIPNLMDMVTPVDPEL